MAGTTPPPPECQSTYPGSTSAANLDIPISTSPPNPPPKSHTSPCNPKPTPPPPQNSTTPPHHSASTHNNNHSEPPQRVLLLVAVQKAMLAPRPIGVPAASTVGPNIHTILSHARSSSSSSHPPLIIHVRNTGDTGDPDEKGSPGWELVHDPLPSEHIIDKLKNNAFAGTELASLIREDAEIIVAGMQSDFCIRATCSTALARGNDVLLVRGAHATYDRLEAFHVGTVTPAQTVEKEIEDELEEAGVVLLDMKDVPSIFDNR